MSARAGTPGVRLQKVLARAGIASRRAAERLIEAGRVRVDGRIARELGVRVDPRNARIEVDGKRIVAEPLVYIVLNKPRGVVCTLSDPQGRPTVAELLRDAGARVLPVGRLDFNTGGALLCTNDGEFANGIAHPRHHAPKEYLVKVGGVVDERALGAFRESISIDGRDTRPADVSLVRVEGEKSWLAVRLEEGRNRQVRRLAEHAGFVVMRLIRTSQAGITVEDVAPGRFRHLTVDELTKLRDDYGVPRRIPRVFHEPPQRDDRQRPPPRDGRPRDGRPRDGRPRDGRPRDGRPRDGRPGPAPRDDRPKSPLRDGRPSFRQGRPPPRDGQPLPRDGRPPSRDGRPPSRDGRPPSRDGRPSSHDGRPTSRGGRASWGRRGT